VQTCDNLILGFVPQIVDLLHQQTAVLER
jgi:hypothetical protein